MSKPIAPHEVGKAKTTRFPPEVFDAFNEVIAKHWDGREATFTQKEVFALLLMKLPNETAESILEKRWLDVERSYESAGWKVEYDRPGYCETYDATFTFKKRTR